MVSCLPVSMAILTLVPTPSVAATSTGSREARALEVEQAAEAADFAVGARPRGRLYQRLDQVDHPVAGVDIDARLRVGEPALLFRHICPHFTRGSYVGIASRAMVRPGLYSAGNGGAGRAAEGRNARPGPGPQLSIPNLITLGRILLVPVVVWAIASGALWLAFLLFLVAGVSDAIDGYLAKHHGMATVLGSYLDPVADKALIVSIYLTLGINGEIPRWLVILVVSRDIMIVGGVVLSWLVGSPLKMRPLVVSKLNTVAQIAFACVVLGSLGFHIDVAPLDTLLMGLVAALTLASVAAYLMEWIRHMNSATAGQ